MKAGRAPEPAVVASAVVIGLGCAIGMFWALSALSAPSHLKARTEVIEQGIERAHAVLRRPREPSHFLPAPICRAAPSMAGDLVRAELGKAARQAGLSAPAITITPSGLDLASQTYPVMFTLEVTDRYDVELGFLSRLAQSEPEVFADSLDLTSRTSAVALKLSGRVECQASS